MFADYLWSQARGIDTSQKYAGGDFTFKPIRQPEQAHPALQTLYSIYFSSLNSRVITSDSRKYCFGIFCKVIEALTNSHQRLDLKQSIADLKQKLATLPQDAPNRDSTVKLLKRAWEKLQSVPSASTEPPSLEDTLVCRDDGDYFAKLFARVGLMPAEVALPDNHMLLRHWRVCLFRNNAEPNFRN